MADNNLYVERTNTGEFAVKKANASRASAVAPTQAEAIARAKKLDPEAGIHVERVRMTAGGGRDKWRKVK